MAVIVDAVRASFSIGAALICPWLALMAEKQVRSASEKKVIGGPIKKAPAMTAF